MFGKVLRSVALFLRKEDGPTAVEYAVMLALIIAVLFTAIGAIGGTTNSMLGDLALQAAAKPNGS